MSSYYLLPNSNIILSNCFKLEYSDIPTQNILSPSLTHYLYELLNNENCNTALFYKLQNDVYPYYNTLINTSKYSHVFFELLEIIQTMHLNKYLDTNITSLRMEDSKSVRLLNDERCKTPLQILSFEQNTKKPASIAFQYIRNTITHSLHPKDNFYYWNNNIYNIHSFERFYLTYAAKNHIIISNNNTYMNNKSILIQICMVLCTQIKKGIFIWKVGDTYSKFSLEIMFFLSSFYEKVYIIKPSIIDVSKSDKYVVCKGFLYDNTYSIYTYLHSFVKHIDTYYHPKKHISSFLNVNIPNFFISKLEEVNYILGQTQLEQLQYLLLLLSHKYKDEKIKNMERLNEQKCIEWCRKNRFFQNPNYLSEVHHP